MKLSRPLGVDVRGFHSSLASLRTKLDAELQGARCSLGASKLRLSAAAERLEQLSDEVRQETRAAMEGMREHLDACAHSHRLRHLVQLARECTHREKDLRLAEADVRDGMEDCRERDRRLSVVQRLQDQELRAYAALASRRQHREADLLWLARMGGRDASRLGDGAVE